MGNLELIEFLLIFYWQEEFFENRMHIVYSHFRATIMMTASASNTSQSLNNKVVKGNWNTIFGDFNLLTGNNNIVIGNFNKVNGRSNRVTGDHNTVSGTKNTVIGSNNHTTGHNNASSPHPAVTFTNPVNNSHVRRAKRHTSNWGTTMTQMFRNVKELIKQKETSDQNDLDAMLAASSPEYAERMRRQLMMEGIHDAAYNEESKLQREHYAGAQGNLGMQGDYTLGDHRASGYQNRPSNYALGIQSAQGYPRVHGYQGQQKPVYPDPARPPSDAEQKILVPADEKGVPATDATKQCIICCDNKISACIVDCGHANLCVTCIRRVVQLSPDKAACPNCNTKITKVIKIFQDI